MKKLIIILFLVLTSCIGAVMTDTSLTDRYYTVIDIDKSQKEEGKSIYYLSAPGSSFYYDYNLTIIDVNGKFAIADTVCFIAYKK